MNINWIFGCSLLLVGLLPFNSIAATFGSDDNAFRRASHHIDYQVEMQSSFTSSFTPLWLNANRYGLSSIDGNNGYLRLGIFHETDSDSTRKWRLGYGADLALSYNFTNTFTIQQLYADLAYRKLHLTIGSKERPMAMKNQKLSSGSQTFGINSRPIPDVRLEFPDYVSITGKSNWIGFRGHFGYGLMTDGNWQGDFVKEGERYAKHTLFHSKSGYIRIGNEKNFPIVFEGGLEMACLFGGTIYNPVGSDKDKIKMGHSVKDFIKAIVGRGCDETDGLYPNAVGNTVGSWLFALTYKGKNWKVKAYYDHYFEDHSMMFFEYGWLDGLLGLEFTFPKNRYVSQLVGEYMNTMYQSGPVYHDHTSAIPDQISGVDNYYNHNLYAGWQHWGQAIGNPLFHSPIYRDAGVLYFFGNRFKAYHLGLSGNPSERIDYRMLYSYMENKGTYAAPYKDIKYCHSFLAEINYKLPKIKKLDLNGWSISAGFALDRGKEIGNNTGGQITIRKTGLLIK